MIIETTKILDQFLSLSPEYTPLITPTTHRDVEKQMDTLDDPNTTPLTRRTIQAKISRAFQALIMMRTQNELQIEQQAGIVNEYKTRKS
jgi:hypothetical protein